MNHYKDVELEIQKIEEYSLISSQTPLISNLNMCENISLIKEVNERLSRKKAEKIADDYLQKINLTKVASARVSQCSSLEIFYTMFIRALMTKEKNIIIARPLSLIQNSKELEKIIQNLHILNADSKNIIILDTITNESRYKGFSCHIIK